MKEQELRFAGSVPASYERLMVPLIFQPYADELARRARDRRPKTILETASGTGVVTRALHAAMPDADIVATDLNQPMLDIAQERLRSGNVRFRQADALDLPFRTEASTWSSASSARCFSRTRCAAMPKRFACSVTEEVTCWRSGTASNATL